MSNKLLIFIFAGMILIGWCILWSGILSEESKLKSSLSEESSHKVLADLGLSIMLVWNALIQSVSECWGIPIYSNGFCIPIKRFSAMTVGFRGSSWKDHSVLGAFCRINPYFFCICCSTHIFGEQGLPTKPVPKIVECTVLLWIKKALSKIVFVTLTSFVSKKNLSFSIITDGNK